MMLLFKGYGVKSISLSFFVFLLSATFNFPAVAQIYEPVDDLILKAKKENLERDPIWLLLLHYKKGLVGLRSLIDDPRFFLAPDGKTNPQSELVATLRAFFNKKATGENLPKCQFPARLHWLKEKLGLSEATISDTECLDFHKWFETISPKSAVLIFPSFYMNNPASMFGHTLIRIDSRSESKLLSYAINYSAYPDSLGLLYPVKGVFGFYKGYFAINHYYDTIKQYNDTEQRDIWEYPLNLSQTEIEKMFYHLWELRNIYSYYYYFDENCSYNLMFLLDAARPSLHLTDSMGLWVLPTDTLRAVRERGLAEKNQFRPSKAAKIRYISSQLDTSSIKESLNIVNKKLEPLQINEPDPELKIKVLDLAIEEIQYRFNTQQISRDDYLKVFLSTLKERSLLGKSDSNVDELSVPSSPPPEEGHRSQRITVGGGLNRSSWFEEVSYRPAYHSFEDMNKGYGEGLQIVFGQTTLRRYDSGNIRLETLDLINILSVSSVDLFFKPISFKIQTGFVRKPDLEGNESLVFQINPGFGAGIKIGSLGLFYGMIETNVEFGPQFSDSYEMGGGVQIGWVKEITNRWKIVFSMENLNYGFRPYFQENLASATQTLQINRDNAITFSASLDQVTTVLRRQMQLNWDYYF